MKLARLSYWFILGISAGRFALTGARVSAGLATLQDMSWQVLEGVACGLALTALSRPAPGRRSSIAAVVLGLALYLKAVSGGLHRDNLASLLIGVLAVVAIIDLVLVPRAPQASPRPEVHA